VNVLPSATGMTAEEQALTQAVRPGTRTPESAGGDLSRPLLPTERARGSGAPGTRVPEWERARAPPGLPKRSCCAAPGGLGQSLGAAPPPVPPPAAARVRASRGSEASGRPPAAPAAQLPAPIAVPAFLTRPHLWGLRSGSGGPGTQASGASGPGGRPARRRGGRRAEPGECRLPARSPGSAPPERAREVRLCRAARPGDRGDLPARSPRSSRLCLPAWPVLRGRGRRGEHTWSAATPYLGDNSVTFQRVFSHLILANTFCHGKAHSGYMGKPTIKGVKSQVPLVRLSDVFAQTACVIC
ncbi:hypothetical protein EI555_015656, partial [Monodon monoceros]